jgi:hypothetical protein
MPAVLPTSKSSTGSGDPWSGPRQAAAALLQYCRVRQWAGADPYDALNSKLVAALPFLDYRLPRLALTQVVKRSPLNLRPFLLVPPGHNPKGVALFIRALLGLRRQGMGVQSQDLDLLLELLRKLRSPDSRYWSWGYHFAWQSRTALFPLGTPNIICTTFAGHALLDAAASLSRPALVEMAVSAADFILETLYFEEPGTVAWFRYMPLAKSKVYNASLLGAAYLCRVAAVTGEKKYLEPALKAARYSASQQADDGSWSYGEHPTQGWIDHFHTGYNLSALRMISRQTGTREFDAGIEKGFRYYLEHFYLPDGTPKYYHNRTYPIDIHSSAQGILTLLEFGDLDPGNVAQALKVCRWTLENMWDRRGFFYFQKHPYYTNRISFMRWSQAWMLLALSTLLEKSPRARLARSDLT